MVAANNSQEKTVVQDLDVKIINGQTVYLDHNGNVVRTVKAKDKRNLFAAAKDKVNQKMPSEKELSMAEILAAQQQQND